MKVVIDNDTDSLGVYLDSGHEVGRYCIVDNPAHERDLLETMVLACIDEGIAHAAADGRTRMALDAFLEQCTCMDDDDRRVLSAMLDRNSASVSKTSQRRT